MSSAKDYLFVYGTLRRKYDLKLKKQVAKDLEYVGRAKVGGAMYDIGRYPGAVKEKESNEIIGDVFLVNNPQKVFRVLDRYEGDEFVRRRNKVKMSSGKSVNAWIYWYTDDTQGKLRIPHKDYFNYLKRKKTA